LDSHKLYTLSLRAYLNTGQVQEIGYISRRVVKCKNCKCGYLDWAKEH